MYVAWNGRTILKSKNKSINERTKRRRRKDWKHKKNQTKLFINPIHSSFSEVIQNEKVFFRIGNGKAHGFIAEQIKFPRKVPLLKISWNWKTHPVKNWQVSRTWWLFVGRLLQKFSNILKRKSRRAIKKLGISKTYKAPQILLSS